MPGPTDRIIRLGPFTLDPALAGLRRGSEPVHLRAKTFALLTYLARTPGRVVPKAELLDALWPDVTVTEDSLSQAVSDLRRALGTEAGQLLRNVPRRGYVLHATPDVAATPPVSGVGDGPPVVAVLPFLLRAGSAEDAALLDRIVEEITHGLGRYGQLRVIARHSAFALRPETTPPGAAAVQLGAAFFVEGIGQGADGRLRIAAALCEAETGRQIWAESFEGAPESFREVQSVIAHRIVTRLTLDVERTIDREPADAGDPGAYRRFIAAVGLLRQYGADVNERARDHLDAAIRLDPEFALAHAYRGLAETMIAGYSLADPATLDMAMAHVTEALRLAPQEARCHWIAGIVQMYRRAYGAAELCLRRALALNPSDADTMAVLGFVLSARGRHDEALDWFRRAMPLNPLHPPWYHHDHAVALQNAGCFEEAIGHFNSVPRRSAHRETRLAACHAMLGQRAEAAQHLRQAEALEPGWDAVAEACRVSDFEHPEDQDRYVAAVAAAVACRAG